MLHRDMQINVDVNPDDILNELDTDDIIDYLENNRKVHITNSKNDLVDDFFHGDFDLKRLLKDLGKNAVANILREYIKEENIVI